VTLLAIDPGTKESGWVVLDDDKIVDSGVWPNSHILGKIREQIRQYGAIAIERFEARGMAISDDSVETILWTGRFIETALGRAELVKRSRVKLHLCGTTQAKDPNVRQALIDIFGPKGTKAAPGGTYGVSKHAWAALGVAATVRGLR
jgi:predicted transcriptional regulator